MSIISNQSMKSKLAFSTKSTPYHQAAAAVTMLFMANSLLLTPSATAQSRDTRSLSCEVESGINYAYRKSGAQSDRISGTVYLDSTSVYRVVGHGRNFLAYRLVGGKKYMWVNACPGGIKVCTMGLGYKQKCERRKPIIQ